MNTIEDYISEFHGMELKPIAEPNKRHNENGILHLAKYYIFKHLKGELTYADIANFQIIVESLTAYDKNGFRVRGLYDRGAGESTDTSGSIRKISHDNITAISSFSRMLEKEGLAYHKDIANHGLKNLMRYDNGSPDSPRWVYRKSHTERLGTSFQWHPRDWYFWLTNGGYKFAKIFAPIAFVANILACMGDPKETSGKWLVFVRLETGAKWSKMMRLNKKICYWILKKKHGATFMDEIAKIYHWQLISHPIREAARQYEY